MARKKKPEIDFETYCKVKHDGDEYSALRALAKVTVEDNPGVAGLSDEGYRAVCGTLTQSQLSALWEIIRVALREDPERLAEFKAFCEQSQTNDNTGVFNNGGDGSDSTSVGYVITFVAGLALSVFVIIGIIQGWLSIGYIIYVIADAIVTVRISEKVSEYFRNRRK